MDGCMDAQMDGWTDAWINGWMDGWMECMHGIDSQCHDGAAVDAPEMLRQMPLCAVLDVHGTSKCQVVGRCSTTC